MSYHNEQLEYLEEELSETGKVFSTNFLGKIINLSYKNNFDVNADVSRKSLNIDFTKHNGRKKIKIEIEISNDEKNLTFSCFEETGAGTDRFKFHSSAEMEIHPDSELEEEDFYYKELLRFIEDTDFPRLVLGNPRNSLRKNPSTFDNEIELEILNYFYKNRSRASFECLSNELNIPEEELLEIINNSLKFELSDDGYVFILDDNSINLLKRGLSASHYFRMLLPFLNVDISDQFKNNARIEYDLVEAEANTETGNFVLYMFSKNNDINIRLYLNDDRIMVKKIENYLYTRKFRKNIANEINVAMGYPISNPNKITIYKSGYKVKPYTKKIWNKSKGIQSHTLNF